MYANHKGIKIEHVQVDLALNPNGDPEAGQNNIERKITLKVNLLRISIKDY